MRTADSCPSAERLAIFAEGQLAGDDRSAMVAHLVQCPVCREVMAETIHVSAGLEDAVVGKPDDAAARFAASQAEAAAAESAGITVDGTQRFPWWPAAAAAAVAASLLAVGFLAWRGGPGPEVTEPVAPGGATVQRMIPDASRYLQRAAELATQVPAPADIGNGGVFAISGAISPAKAAFRIGVDLIRLQVGVGQGDEEKIQTAGRRVGSSLSGIEGSEALVASFAALQDEVESAALVPHTASWLETRGLGAPMALGAWAELGRLAVAAGDTAHFDAATVKALRQANAAEPFPQGVGRTLGEIEAMSVSGDLSAGELLPDEASRLERLLRDLIEMI